MTSPDGYCFLQLDYNASSESSQHGVVFLSTKTLLRVGLPANSSILCEEYFFGWDLVLRYCWGDAIVDDSPTFVSGKRTSNGDFFADLLLERAGPYTLRIEVVPPISLGRSATEAEENSKLSKSGEIIRVVVTPDLYLPKSSVHTATSTLCGCDASGQFDQLSLNDAIKIPFSALCSISILPRCLGPCEDWDRVLSPITQAGYNLIHFMPVQRLGESQSVYSISDHLDVEPSLFSSGCLKDISENGKVQRLSKFKSIISSISRELKTKTLIDLVWNHASPSSHWLRQHPECGFSLENTPELHFAYEMDRAVAELSRQVALKYNPAEPPVPVCTGVHIPVIDPIASIPGPFITSAQDIDQCMTKFKEDILPKYRLWEFQVIDTRAAVSVFRKQLGAEAQSSASVTSAARKTAGLYHSNSMTVSKQSESSYLERTSDLRGAVKVVLAGLGSGREEYVLLGDVGTRCPTSPWRGGVKASITKSLALFNIPTESVVLTPGEIDRRVFQYSRALDHINLELYHQYDDDVAAALTNIRNAMLWEFIDSKGPRRGVASDGSPIPISVIANPLVTPYFSHIYPTKEDEDRCDNASSNRDDCVALANNGWVWGGGLEMTCETYLRRELVVWGDCVKLRYGDGPASCPFLWDLMSRYTETMATMFDGVRLDNCHNTPIHVSSYLLHRARLVNPNVIVLAELFTGSLERDAEFVGRLGITALVREGMHCKSDKALSDEVYKASVGTGEHCSPISSLYPFFPTSITSYPVDGDGEVAQWESVLWTAPSAMFYDCTHDNDPCCVVHEAEHALALSTIVAASCAASGSVLGYDELRKFKLPVTSLLQQRFLVKEPSRYPTIGIVAAKSHLNRLHADLNSDGFDQFFCSAEDNVISIHRRNSRTNNGILFLARAAFKGCPDTYGMGASVTGAMASASRRVRAAMAVRACAAAVREKGGSLCDELHDKINIDGPVPFVEVSVPGIITGIGLAARIQIPRGQDPVATISPDIIDDSADNYLRSAIMLSDTDPDWCCTVKSYTDDFGREREKLSLCGLGPGTSVIYRTGLSIDENLASQELRSLLVADSPRRQHLREVVGALSVLELNLIMYRSESEERSLSGGCRGVYSVPSYGALSYAGLQGFETVLRLVRQSGDMGHPLLNNVRTGNWAMDYMTGRLTALQSIVTSTSSVLVGAFNNFLTCAFDQVKILPRFIVPFYFDVVIRIAYEVCVHRITQMQSEFVRGHGAESFVGALARASVSLYGYGDHNPGNVVNDLSDNNPNLKALSKKLPVSLAAGLPHFASGIWRCWGRDTFISLRGLFLVTGMWDIAKDLLLSYACTVRHDLIPNLFDHGKKPRYNARDAVWWWLQAVQDYVTLVDNGYKILSMSVVRIDEKGACSESSIVQIIQEILVSHAKGIDFVEASAGPALDMHMKPEGFHVTIKVNWSTGLIHGGNKFNQGTWMDKLGSSDTAGSRGIPGSSRDGAAIELIGLLWSTLSWLSELRQHNRYPYSGVHCPKGEVSWAQWRDLITENFEPAFWVPEYDAATALSSPRSPTIGAEVRRRGIYKDTVGGSNPSHDTRFRPNLVIAMAVAPKMFNRQHARTCLAHVASSLLGKLGMKTLDPYDPNYRGVYDNDWDGPDFAIAKGLNYHMGPEWLWLTGYFLRATLLFGDSDDQVRAPWGNNHEQFFNSVIQHHRKEIMGDWAGLVELTNTDGLPCKFSCGIQAWSHATLLDALYDLHMKIKK